VKVHLDNALGGLASKARGRPKAIRRSLELATDAVRAAVRALERGEHDEASRLLTAAADVEFRLTGDAECVGPLFDVLGLQDGAERRVQSSNAS
jgi:hypothetical protein